jgi:hypothetical protein
MLSIWSIVFWIWAVWDAITITNKKIDIDLPAKIEQPWSNHEQFD